MPKPPLSLRSLLPTLIQSLYIALGFLLSLTILAALVTPLILGISIKAALPVEEDAQSLDAYFTTLPEEESINASLYHYEILVKEAQELYANKKYIDVLFVYKTYREIFYEAEILDESELLYVVGLSLQELCSTASPLLDEFAENEPRYVSILGAISYDDLVTRANELSATTASKKSPKTEIELPGLLFSPTKQPWTYTYKHFSKIIEDRRNYPLEWKTIREYYQQIFIPNAQTASEHQKNFDQLYYLVTHFPEMTDYRSLMTHTSLIEPSLLNKKQREQWEILSEILLTYEQAAAIPRHDASLPARHNHHANGSNGSNGSDGSPSITSHQASTSSAQSNPNHAHETIFTRHTNKGNESFLQSNIVFSRTGGLVLRSRSSILRSRNFLRLEAWEPVFLIDSVVGEDGKRWWRAYYQNIQTPIAYIPIENGFLSDLETFDGDILSDDRRLPLSASSTAKLYSEATQFFYARDYIRAADAISKLQLQSNLSTIARERILTLLYRTLQEITRRSTSLNNDYTRFVQAHPEYFEVGLSTDHPAELLVRKTLLKEIIALNPNSAMLQYHQSH